MYTDKEDWDNDEYNRTMINNLETEQIDSCTELSRVKWAINSFMPFKSAGEDQIFPALLQKTDDEFFIIIQTLYRHSLKLGYVPKSWRGVLVTFISKPEKEDYSIPSSYRPISLMSFILKGLEKLIDREIREVDLIVNPLRNEQHAYRRGRGTESAIHNLVNYIEKSTERNKINITVLIDISGAFDNTKIDTIEEHARSKNVKNWVLNWLLMMLKNRRVKAIGEACSTKIKPNRGCPQGGVLSPLLWSLCVDSLIQRLREEGLHITAYADDLAISTMGDNSKVCCDNLNKAMTIVEQWCTITELHVNPKKTEMVRFTKKYKIGLEMKKVKLFNEELHLSDNVKYLGVHLDSKLSMNEHVKQLYKKGIKSLWATRAMVSRTWGLNPKTMLWVYKQIILPRITYGSVITWKAIENNNTLNHHLKEFKDLPC